MAQEMIVRIWCDLCMRKEPSEKTEGETLIMTVGFGKPHELDVCDDCRAKTTFEDMVEALYEVGREYTGPNLDLSRYCTEPSCERSVDNWTPHHSKPPFGSVAGVRRHLTRTHKMDPEAAKRRTLTRAG